MTTLLRLTDPESRPMYNFPDVPMMFPFVQYDNGRYVPRHRGVRFNLCSIFFIVPLPVKKDGGGGGPFLDHFPGGSVILST